VYSFKLHFQLSPDWLRGVGGATFTPLSANEVKAESQRVNQLKLLNLYYHTIVLQIDDLQNVNKVICIAAAYDCEPIRISNYKCRKEPLVS
jgi:hypothetical protein